MIRITETFEHFNSEGKPIDECNCVIAKTVRTYIEDDDLPEEEVAKIRNPLRKVENK